MCERTAKTGATNARLCLHAKRKAESSYGITISRGDSASLRLGVFSVSIVRNSEGMTPGVVC